MSLPDERLDILAAEVIRRTLSRLPEPIQAAAKPCLIETVFMQDCLINGEPIEEDLLGVFEGLSLEDGDPEAPSHLPRIRLFLDNLWDYAEADVDIFREEVRVTLLHELGHFLGFDEEQVAQLGLA